MDGFIDVEKVFVRASAIKSIRIKEEDNSILVDYNVGSSCCCIKIPIKQGFDLKTAADNLVKTVLEKQYKSELQQ